MIVDALSGGGTVQDTGGQASLTVGIANGSGTFSGTIAQVTSLTKAGSGVEVFSGNIGYSGPITINGGTLQIGNGGVTGSLGSGGVTDNAVLAFNRSDNGLVVANAISGPGSVVQLGTGLTMLSGNNSYYGGTNVVAGILEANSTAALPFGGLNVINVYNGAVLAVQAKTGGPWTNSDIDNLVTSSNFYPGSSLGINVPASYSFTANSDFGLVAYSSGEGLTKLGGGTLILTVTASAATTTISAGTLQLGDGASNNGSLDGGSGPGTCDITNNAAVVFANPYAQTYSGAISGSGSLAKLAGGTLFFSGNNSYTGGTTISGGTLALGGGGVLGGGNYRKHLQQRRLGRQHQQQPDIRRNDLRPRFPVPTWQRHHDPKRRVELHGQHGRQPGHAGPGRQQPQQFCSVDCQRRHAANLLAVLRRGLRGRGDLDYRRRGLSEDRPRPVGHGRNRRQQVRQPVAGRADRRGRRHAPLGIRPGRR